MAIDKITKLKAYIKVTLTNGGVVIIDHEDSWIIEKFPNWYQVRNHVTVGRSIPTEFGPVEQRLYIHKLIVKERKWQIDHIDRNGLNNRRSNLRKASPSQNAANSGPKKKNKIGYKGVLKEKRKLTKPYLASLCGKNLGRYKTAEEAALVYDKAAIEKYGDFAFLNFPPKGRR
jgi:hypothetical protein